MLAAIARADRLRVLRAALGIPDRRRRRLVRDARLLLLLRRGRLHVLRRGRLRVLLVGRLRVDVHVARVRRVGRAGNRRRQHMLAAIARADRLRVLRAEVLLVALGIPDRRRRRLVRYARLLRLLRRGRLRALRRGRLHVLRRGRLHVLRRGRLHVLLVGR